MESESLNFLDADSTMLLWSIAIGVIPFFLMLFAPSTLENLFKDSEKQRVGFLRSLAPALGVLLFFIFPIFLGSSLVAAMWKGLELPMRGVGGGIGNIIALVAGFGCIYVLHLMEKNRAAKK